MKDSKKIAKNFEKNFEKAFEKIATSDKVEDLLDKADNALNRVSEKIENLNKKSNKKVNKKTNEKNNKKSNENVEEKTNEKAEEKTSRDEATKPDDIIQDKNIQVESDKNTNQSFWEKYKKVIIVLAISLVVILIILGMIIRMILGFFSDNKTSTNNNPNIEVQDKLVIKYRVKIHIDFPGNLIFSKYDVSLSSAGNYHTLNHGENADFEFLFEEGKHTLKFTNKEDFLVSEEVDIDVNSNMELGYQISCYNDRIDVSKLYVDKDEELVSNEIKLTNDKANYIGKNYQDVINAFKNLGFSNISENAIYDIDSSGFSWYKDGEVTSVKINDKEDFKKGDVLKNDAKIVITYHKDKNSNPSLLAIPYNNKTVGDKKYSEVVDAFKKAGFTNVTAIPAKVVKTSSNSNLANTVKEISIDGELVEEGKKYKKDSSVSIFYIVLSDPDPRDLLDEAHAKSAFEKYGKSIYKYGFKCHWLIGLIRHEQSSDGSWYFEVEVTITNMFDAKYKTVASGRVSGTNSSMRITNFSVKD